MKSSTSRKRSLAHASISSRKARFSITNTPSSVIAWLQHVQLQLSVTVDRKAVQYLLHTKHALTDHNVVRARSFDEYQQLQQRLLRVLVQGHMCTAECPWLFSFVTSYFPKKHFFTPAHATRVVLERRDGLTRFLSTLVTFVLERSNQSCDVVVNGVARELVAFFGGDDASLSLDTCECHHETSSEISTDDEHSSSTRSSVLSSSSDESMCVLCDCSLETARHDDADSHSQAQVSRDGSFVSSSSWTSSQSSRCYTTTLGCGHQFHDECIVVRLNEDLSCPSSRCYTTTLGCGHQFHDECIVARLNEDLSCPLEPN
ncbi:TPA: hypothetical protein N0F65_003378 [Lagenidium giganteum]|uniref:RING-type domain-containing protein n=1 Tax=Lagenidium giganteum TaxID=4803 RepID=A0AAV2Z706_9STRA|nr:TPA: hypothetical protein N0F65_003378 [Lagenidium giganteum]